MLPSLFSTSLVFISKKFSYTKRNILNKKFNNTKLKEIYSLFIIVTKVLRKEEKL